MAQSTRWLIEPLWGSGAVGLIGGAPKSGKTWLALELAAVGSSCLCLVFAAEDAPITSSTASAAWPPAVE